MNKLYKIENKLEEIIDKTITNLKIEAVANMIYFLNDKNTLDNYELDISVHEKSIRRDYHYDSESSFNSLYSELRVNNQKTIEFKDIFKDVFTFSMKYKPKEIDSIFDLNIQNDKYNSNQLLNEVVHSSFFINTGKKTPQIIFEKIVKLLEKKGVNKKGYFYIEPINEETKNLMYEIAAESREKQAILDKQQLFEELNKIIPPKTTRKKI